MPLRAASRLLRAIAWLLAALVAAIGVYLGGTLVGAVVPATPTMAVAASSDRGASIVLLTSLLHADFAIPVDDRLKRRFAFLGEQGVPLEHPGLRYLVFGWGARGFYIGTPTLADISAGPALKAVFGDRSVMHVAPAGEVRDLPGAIGVDLPAGGMERLLAFIEESFARRDGAPLPIPGSGYGIGDAFYEGRGRFDILRPCNIWVAQGLRRAGLGTGAWTPTTHSLRLGLRLHAPLAIRYPPGR